MNKKLTLVASLLVVLGSALSAQMRQDESRLRTSLATSQKPVYPAALLPKKIAGVAVASVLVAATGKVEAVVVLEAPDPLMAESVRTAVMQWTFRPPATQGAQGLVAHSSQSKLTFYFEVRNGIGVVLNPDEMPGGQPPAPAGAGLAPGQTPKVVMGDHHSVPQIDDKEFQRLIALGSAVIVDVRERDAFRRGHREGAINIPHDEIGVRGPIELPASKTVVIECSQASEGVCSMGAIALTDRARRAVVFRP